MSPSLDLERETAKEQTGEVLATLWIIALVAFVVAAIVA